jgi:predicted Rossmann-fold nucleotide-binding protein
MKSILSAQVVAPAMMEAANKGAKDAGGKSVALGISLPFEQGVNSYADSELSFEFHYFFLRKFYFLYHAKAIVVYPGGFGTMDELFETLTLSSNKQTTQETTSISLRQRVLGRVDQF